MPGNLIFFFLFISLHFVTIPNCGTIKSTLTLLVERLDWTSRRLNCQPTGVHTDLSRYEARPPGALHYDQQACKLPVLTDRRRKISCHHIGSLPMEDSLGIPVLAAGAL